MDEIFEITEERKSTDMMFSELIYRLESQFNSYSEFGIDRYDYFNHFLINFLDYKDNDFPNNIGNYINNDETEELYNIFIDTINRCFYNIYGIIFDESADNYLLNLYDMYHFIVVNPEIIIKEYLLYYNNNVNGYEFKSFFENRKLLNNTIVPNLSTTNVVKHFNNLYDVYYKNKENNTDFSNMSNEDLINYFISYASQIFGDMNEYVGSELFNKLNRMFPCDNYDRLDDEFNIHFSIRFESDDLFVTELFKKNLNITYLENYIKTKILVPFLDYVNETDRLINLSLSDI